MTHSVSVVDVATFASATNLPTTSLRALSIGVAWAKNRDIWLATSRGSWSNSWPVLEVSMGPGLVRLRWKEKKFFIA